MSTVETTEALDALPPEVAVYPGTDADDQHVYIRDTTEGCWVAYVRADCVGVEEIPLPAYVPSHTAADQPTTEPSEAVIETVSDAHRAAMVDDWGDEGGGYDFEAMTRALIERGWSAPAPAPQPAADTETEVQWGVRRPDGTVTRWPTPPGVHDEESLRGYVLRILGPDFTVVSRTGTYTPWEEA